jgi:hypothetical protein
MEVTLASKVAENFAACEISSRDYSPVEEKSDAL